MGENWSTMTGFRPTWAKFVSTIPDFAQHGRNLSPPCPDFAQCVQICPRCDGISPSMGGRISAERLAPSTTGGQGRRSRPEQHLTTDTCTRLATLPTAVLPPARPPTRSATALSQPFHWPPNPSTGPTLPPPPDTGPRHRDEIFDGVEAPAAPWGTPLPIQGMPDVLYGAWRGCTLPTADARAEVGGAWDALQNSTSGKACVQISPKRVNF